MKRFWTMARIARLMAMILILSVFSACSVQETEKTEQDYIKELKYRSKRQLALQRLANAKDKDAIPAILDLIERQYSTQACVKTLGQIGDPVVLPDLKRLLDRVYTKQPKHLDRLAEEITLAMGRIGDKQATPWLIEVIDSPVAGPLGQSGAIRALGMIGDVKAVPSLINYMVDESKFQKKIGNRLLAIKSLYLLAHQSDQLTAEIRQSLIEALTIGMFIEENNLNLFRESKEALAAIGGPEVTQWLVKTFNKENAKVEAYTDILEKNFGFKKYYIQVKALDAIGFVRDPSSVPFLLKVALDPSSEYIWFAKAVQALERIGSPEMIEPMLSHLKAKKIGTYEEISANELLIRSLGNTYDNRVLDYMFTVFKAGNRTVGGKSWPQECWSAAYVIASVDDGSRYDEFKQIADAGTCKGELDAIQKRTAEYLVKQFMAAMELTKTCQKDVDCYHKALINNKATSSTDTTWGVRWKALRMMVTLGASDKAAYLVDGSADATNESVRYAAADAAFRIVKDKAAYSAVLAFWMKDKTSEYTQNAELQKATEELGYTLQLIRQRLGIKDPVYSPFQ